MARLGHYLGSALCLVLPARHVNAVRSRWHQLGARFRRTRWWFDNYYRPLVTSRFRKRRPELHCFSRTNGSYLRERLRRVNVAAPTKMCRIMTVFGSDKGLTWHNYTTLYSALFRGIWHKPLRIFELGLGSNNLEMPFNMGAAGRPGASLRAWAKLFPRASVYGADIDRDVLFQEDRIKTFYCDQLDQASICELWNQPDLRDGMDIIIEDGYHSFEANVSFLEGSLHHLRSGGIYIVEDIERRFTKAWLDRLESNSNCPDFEFAFVELPNPQNPDWNNLLIVHKG